MIEPVEPQSDCIAAQTGEPRAWTYGWNLLVTAIVVIAPLALILIEYKLRDEICALRGRAACHALEFFTPAMMAAALAVVLPCMNLSITHRPRLPLPPAPSLTRFAARRRWAHRNRLARRRNCANNLIWILDHCIAFFALVLSCGIFAMWLLSLHPEGSVGAGETWGTPHKLSCTAYALATLLTLSKITLERYRK
ncbi:conserved membrane hypothetical protein [Paraburkholderia tropica]|nr:conserved membrane hypothetical protein [Paraburkholderia tropica]